MWAMAAWTPKEGTYWGRFDFHRKLFHVGCLHQKLNGINASHALEVEYNWEKENKGGLRKTPITIRDAAEYYLSDKTTLKSLKIFGKDFFTRQEVNHKADSHWNFGVWQEYNSAHNTVGGPPAYHTGFNVHY